MVYIKFFLLPPKVTTALKLVLMFSAQLHTREGYEKQPPPEQICKKLLNKNAIKPKIGDPLWQLFLKTLTPRDFSENIFELTP
jgi:hypothetical protein